MVECVSKMFRLCGVFLGVDLVCLFYVLGFWFVFGGLFVVLNKSIISLYGIIFEFSNFKFRVGKCGIRVFGEFVEYIYIRKFLYFMWV